MTTSLDCKFPNLVGNQDAYYLLSDEGDQSEAERALTFYGRIKRDQMPWQEATTRAILALEPDGLFTHPTVALIVGRQNGKTLAAADLRVLFGLFLRGERIIYSAQRWSTAESIFKRLMRLIKARPSLNNRVVRQTCSQGQASIELENGALAGFITRSLDAGRGLDEIDLIIYDESYNLKDAETAALSPTQLASKNPQTIYLSSAVNQEIHANGVVLAGIRHRAIEAITTGAKKTGLYYREHMAPPAPEDCSDAERRALREDPEMWRLASPSYGVIQTDAKVRKLLIDLGPKMFEVEVLGWGDWPPIAGASRVIDPDFWNEQANLSLTLTGPAPRVIGVDLSPTTRTWSIAGVQYTEAGTVYGEIGFSEKASPTDVVAKLMELITDADPAAVLIQQQSPAAMLKPLLIEAGVEPEIVNQSEFAVACEGILEATKAGQFAHNGWRTLADSVAATAKKDLPGGRFIWTSGDGGGSITHWVSMTLAHWGLLTFGKPPKRSAPPLADSPEVSENSTRERDFDSFDAMEIPF